MARDCNGEREDGSVRPHAPVPPIRPQIQYAPHRMKRLLTTAALFVFACSHATPPPAPAPVPAPQPMVAPAPAPEPPPPPPPPPVRVNPLFSASTLQYQAPVFDQIQDTDYQPAIEEGMKQQIGEIDAIANDSAAPAFDNTIVAMEKSGALLTRAAKIFF